MDDQPPRVSQVRYLGDYRLEVTFSDRSVKEMDFQRRVTGRGGLVRALENPEFFAQVKVDPESGTLAWPNGVDFCPDVLYAEATGKPYVRGTAVIAAE